MRWRSVSRSPYIRRPRLIFRRAAVSSAKIFLATGLLMLFWAAPSRAQVIDLDQKPTKEKPEIWTKASDAGTKRAEEAARKDACLQLVETVYRLPVSGSRDVLDMMIRNPQVNNDLTSELTKAKSVGAEYLDDGTVRVTVATTPVEVTAILKKAYEKVDWAQAEEDGVIAAVGQVTKPETQLLGVGEAGLEGSPGEKRTAVRRAALVKAEREIVLQILAMALGDGEGRKHVRDFALYFPQVPRKIALGMSTARIESEKFAADGSVELRAEVNVVNVTELVYRAEILYDVQQKWSNNWFGAMLTSTREMIFGADAKAAAGEAGPKNDTPLALELQAVNEALKVTPKD
jgi:hypothetical protein